MLQIASFEIKEGEKISKFLYENTLAKDATLIISNGLVGIPYEDGKDLTIPQQIIRLKEQKNLELGKIRYIYEHSKRVMEVKAHGLREEVKKLEERISTLDLEGAGKKQSYDVKKECEKEIKIYENMIKQAEESARQTQAQITDSMVEIAVYDEEIHKLEVDLGNQK